MAERFDVAIVGAGPGASMAAYLLAKAGLSVIVFERGDFPGAKAMFGGVLYTTVLSKFFPDFVQQGCVERHVVEKRFSMLSKEDEVAMSFKFLGFEPPYYNHSFTALRAHFDRYLARQAEQAGAMIVTQTVVDQVIMRDGVVTGVRARREGGDVEANVVIAADGANSLIAQSAGLRGELPLSVILGIKEIVSLPRPIIEDRFSLDGDEGVAYEYLGGEAVKGAMGAGFLYTNRDTISVGLGVPLQALQNLKVQPDELLNHFKMHPVVRRLLRGTKPEEYSAHLIPEMAPQHLPRFVGNGVMVIGGAAGLVNANPMFHEGTNMAMASGVLAAQTIIEAHKAGNYSAQALQPYVTRLRQSFAWQDYERYERLTRMAESHPQLFNKYPYEFAAMARKLFSVLPAEDGMQTPKRKLELAAADHMLAELGLMTFATDLVDIVKAAIL
jgi:electron transfer flavoprotein-quinone oxidoreductase